MFAAIVTRGIDMVGHPSPLSSDVAAGSTVRDGRA